MSKIPSAMTPSTLLEELLRYRQARPSQTPRLAAYNHDELCRKIEDQIELMLDSFRKYQHISHMVQGPRDQGVDVLLKSLDDPSEGERYVGIQVKSFKEVANKENDLSKQLKSGYFDAKDRYGCGLSRYYILLAGDSRLHAKRMDAITNEFAKTKDVRVINSRYLLTFLDMPQSTVAAVVDRHLSEEDYVRRQALSEAAAYTAPELRYILACLFWAFENSSDQLPENFWVNDSRMVELAETYGPEVLDQCLASFSDSDFESYAEPPSTRIRLEHFPAIRALYYDLQVRYEDSDDDLFDHLFEFLNEDDDWEGVTEA